MSFTLHIFFAGLIAFVPSQDGRELTVLVPDAGHGHTLSDSSVLEPHRALLVARAAGCKGDCGTQDSGIARILFADQGDSKASGALADAMEGGAAWPLGGVDLSVSPQEGQIHILQDFNWVADLNRIVPGAGVVDPQLLNDVPKRGKIAARLRLSSGKVRTYRLVQAEKAGVPSLRFRNLKDGKDAAPGYSQALADWVVAEIEVPGDVLTVEASPFGKPGKRSIQLSPEKGVVEIVVMNVPVSRSKPEPGEPGKHFEMYYELTEHQPALRPVPYIANVGEGSSPAGSGSKLLDALQLGDPRGVYDRLICPLAQLSDGRDR